MRVGTCRMGSFCLNGTVVLYICPLSLPNMTSIEKKKKNEWKKKVKGIMIDEYRNKKKRKECSSL